MHVHLVVYDLHVDVRNQRLQLVQALSGKPEFLDQQREQGEHERAGAFRIFLEIVAEDKNVL